MSNIAKQFDSTPITFNDDGFFNATEAAKMFGKLPNDWLRLDETCAYVAELEKATSGLLVAAKRGNGGGTWLHRLLLPSFARWLGGTSVSAAIDGSIVDYSAILAALNDFEVPDDLPDMLVYAIRNTVTGSVKLGISRDPLARMAQLQTGNDCLLELAAVRPAVNRFADERAQHVANAGRHIRGEWFAAGAELTP